MVLHADEDCPFCTKIIRGHSASEFDLILAEHDRFVVTPALGMLVPGYLLLIARQHVPSLARLGPAGLCAIDRWLDRHLPGWAARFGDYFRFEHGMGEGSCSGACIAHAHLHLIPAASAVDRIEAALPWQLLASYEDLAGVGPQAYAYLGSRGRHAVVPQPTLPGQWVRRQTALALHLDHWDWGAYRGDRELAATLTRRPRGTVRRAASGTRPARP
jgi:diadenosine tetraphosphate (Ap4A) HIT family hydrolase